jgi:protocatechuate 3,4-dioxygenase beta subunit
MGFASVAAVAAACDDSGTEDALDAAGPRDGGAGGAGDNDASATDSGAPDAHTAAPDSATPTCTVYPRQTEGPYYLDLGDLRHDITEGKPGTPMAVIVELQGRDCAPFANAVVDIWHCDAQGVYSGFPGQLGNQNTSGQKFLRGSQITDANGRARFQTIYPGWYPGRTTHIHFKVHLSSSLEATSQMYFPEAINSAVYATAPYSARGQKDTSNVADGVNRGTASLATVVRNGDVYEATLIVVVAN